LVVSDEGRLTGDGDRFFQRADFQRDVQADELLHAHGDSLPPEGL
jgi:hypothetical protein